MNNRIKVEQFTVEGWGETETGLVVAESEDWTLIKSIPVDYVVDGYKLIRKRTVEARSRNKQEKMIERVLNLKGVAANAPAGFGFGNTLELMQWVEARYGLIEFQGEKQDECTYGKINSVEDEHVVLNSVNPRGIEFEAEDYFEVEAIRVITFETDYFNSIRLLWLDGGM